MTGVNGCWPYSSIRQGVFIIIGLVSGTRPGIPAWCFIFFGLPVLNLGGFICVILFSYGRELTKLVEYSGLYQKDPSDAVP